MTLRGARDSQPSRRGAGVDDDFNELHPGLVRVTTSGSVITSGTRVTPGSGLYSDDAMFFDFVSSFN